MIRKAQPQDARLIERLIVDHLSATTESFIHPTLTRIRTRLRDPNIVTFVDTQAESYVALVVREAEEEVEVDPWLPRGGSLRRRMMPVLAAACRAVKSQWPQSGGWGVIGDIADTVDAQGNRDDGTSQIEAYQRGMLNNRGEQVVKKVMRGGRTQGTARLDALLDVFQAVSL